MVSIFVFHSDLRLQDNTGLIQALTHSDEVLPVFIFTPEQVTTANKYRSIRAIEFMVSQLESLDSQLKLCGSKLYMFYGDTVSIIGKLVKAVGAKMVISNAGYTPYALDRDTRVDNICERLNCDFVLCEDYGLYDIGRIIRGGKKAGNVYKKFTPFYNAASKVKPRNCETNNYKNYFSKNIKGCVTLAQICRKLNVSPAKVPSATQMLNSIKKYKNYNAERNELSLSTSHLSAYIKFGSVSIRQVYWEAKHELGRKSSDFIKQLFWREFYMNILWQYSYVLEGKNFNRNFHANWKTNAEGGFAWDLEAWCKGKTGFPVVDACMTELNETGFMHNRGRLIVAGFLTKILGWHWKFGERYFANKLVDYDPAQNNGNWQFVAGSGVDQQPYFRMFNPWLQSAKHDPECIYIKKWCPQYKNFPNDVLHDELKLRNYISVNRVKKIPLPIVEYTKARDSTRKKYK
jgi:deoxyribodipyrimidine photo-lyase